MYEAHFLPSHLTVALLAEVIYGAVVGANRSTSTHPFLLWSFSFCGTLRLIGFVATGIFMYLYEAYHLACVRAREDEMKRVGLYDNMQENFSYRSFRKNWFDYCALPVNGTSGRCRVLPSVDRPAHLPRFGKAKTTEDGAQRRKGYTACIKEENLMTNAIVRPVLPGSNQSPTGRGELRIR